MLDTTQPEVQDMQKIHATDKLEQQWLTGAASKQPDTNHNSAGKASEAPYFLKPSLGVLRVTGSCLAWMLQDLPELH